MKWLKSLGTRLDELNPRERLLVTWGGAFAVLCLLWLVLLDPALSTLNGAKERRSELIEQAAKVKRAAMDLTELQGTRSRVVVKSEEVMPRLQTLLNQEGLAETTLLTRTEEGGFEVSLAQTSVASLLQWLTQAESLSNVGLVSATLDKQEAGLVSGNLIFRLKDPSEGTQ